MFNRESNIIVGLEIGTSKVCCIVAELDDKGVPTIIGIGQSRSNGVRKSEIIDQERAIEEVSIAINEAEQMSDVEVKNVYLAVTGSHIKAFTCNGFHPIHAASKVITQADVDEVIRNAKTVNIPPGDMIVHSIRQHFIVDQKEDVINPLDMLGTKLEVNILIVHGSQSRVQTPVRLLKNQLQIEVDNVVFSGLASSLALLNKEQKEIGTLVIDLGAGTTDYVVTVDGLVKHCGVIAVGGDHITNDLAQGLRLPIGQAEQLKIKFGSAIPPANIPDKFVVIENDLGLKAKTINLEHLYLIMALRIEETLELIRQDLQETGIIDSLRGGVVLCGGGARIPRILELTEHVFQLPAMIGNPVAIGGISSALKQPEFVTPIGLIKFASMFKRKSVSPRYSLTDYLKNIFGTFGK
ncbi:MAG TPA: cell division protein FtsA [Verrucomicrobiota bacterium]|nr:cell division protein FtsA [Verrucomicrobiota bacterium]